jgi:AcrR family transcriptional regulator
MTQKTEDVASRSGPRTRHPERKELILDAAVQLIAEEGFHDVSMASIGASAGIVGSGIYRHFESKAAILVEVFERVIDWLLEQQQTVIDTIEDYDLAFEQLIADQIQFVVGNRPVAQVYHNEVQNLPGADYRRLRRKQRIYVNGWVLLLQEKRPGLEDSYARTVVHCAIGAIQSTLVHNAGLPETQLRDLLARVSRVVLEH